MDYVDSELLIQEVEKYPCLYDINNQYFKNRHMKTDSWMYISKALYGDKWLKMNATEQNNFGKLIRKRWKNMRDTYLKSLKTEVGKNRKPYIFSKQMFFLQRTNQLRHTPSDILEINIVEPPLSPSIEDCKQSNKRKPDLYIHETSSLKYIRPECDPDEMFFLSLMPHVKLMKPADKIDLQLKFLQLLQSYNIDQPNVKDNLDFSSSQETLS